MSRITNAEWDIIRTLWSESPATVSELKTRLAGKTWSASTIRTLLARLEKKGLVLTGTKGKSRAYSPVLPQEQTIRVEASAFLDRVFAGDATELIAHFLHHEKFKKSALSDLQSLIKQKKKER